MRHWTLIAGLLMASSATAQGPILLEEHFAPNTAYHVSFRMNGAIKLTLPDKTTYDGKGNSEFEYDERVLRVSVAGAVDKTLRQFSHIHFERQIGSEQQKATLRPQVRRLVVLRQDNIEAPFSPDGPLKLSEIDLIRTDVFTPALAGMLPKRAVKPGAEWKADEASVRELTDLFEIKNGDLMCRFDKVDQMLAKVSFEGTISGIGENGPTKHELDGVLYFDLSVRAITYVSLKGAEYYLNKKDQGQGKNTGDFILTRTPIAAPPAIAESANLVVDPNEVNTSLLFEDQDLGVRFVHARKWKPYVERTQVKLDDQNGNGLTITIDPLSRVPTLPQFLGEAKAGIERQRGRIRFEFPMHTLQRQPTSVESIALDVEAPADKSSKQAIIVLAVIRDEAAAATFAATLTTSNRQTLAREAERIAASIRVGKTK
jgi:hypothetical protein